MRLTVSNRLVWTKLEIQSKIPMCFLVVAALAEVLTDAKRLGLDIGSDTLLEKYQKWRRFDSAVMLATTDSLNRLFSNDIRPLKVARDLGLVAINKLDPVKKIFMQHAMGSTGDLPRLLKGQPL